MLSSSIVASHQQEEGELAYEMRMDRKRSYACYTCAKNVEDAYLHFLMARAACQAAAAELRKRRDGAAQFHILVLDAAAEGDTVSKMLRKEESILFKMMKTATMLSMLEDRRSRTAKDYNSSIIRSMCCLHRYEKMVAVAKSPE